MCVEMPAVRDRIASSASSVSDQCAAGQRRPAAKETGQPIRNRSQVDPRRCESSSCLGESSRSPDDHVIADSLNSWSDADPAAFDDFDHGAGERWIELADTESAARDAEPAAMNQNRSSTASSVRSANPHGTLPAVSVGCSARYSRFHADSERRCDPGQAVATVDPWCPVVDLC